MRRSQELLVLATERALRLVTVGQQLSFLGKISRYRVIGDNYTASRSLPEGAALLKLYL